MSEALFETDRLIARRLVAGDEAAMTAIYGDEEAMVFVGDGRALSEADCLYWIEVTDKNFQRRGYGMIAFVERATGELIACGGIVHPGQQEEPEVKYAIRRDKWGHGFATEAVRGLISYGSSVLGLTWMQATIAPGNSASQRVVSKAGFRHVRDRVNEDESVTQVWEWGINHL
jgi:RimJ/RimL family protein N-acetyltransferase